MRIWGGVGGCGWTCMRGRVWLTGKGNDLGELKSVCDTGGLWAADIACGMADLASEIGATTYFC